PAAASARTPPSEAWAEPRRAACWEPPPAAAGPGSPRERSWAACSAPGSGRLSISGGSAWKPRRSTAAWGPRPRETVRTGANPDNQTEGSVSPVRTDRTPAGDYCREFEQTVTIGGQPQRSSGTACRQPDGTWRMVN